MNSFLAYLATLVPLAVFDALWLMVIAKGFYAERMGFLFQKTINLAPVVLFYPLYALAVYGLVVAPAVASGSWGEVLWRGALLGLAAYGAYDLTNHATIAKWPLVITVVDILWGVVVTALTSVTALWIIAALKRTWM
ncbi:MAG: DUF2177 family protein [Candidatus Paceibacterota bacterium]|nr:MAG: DUF2177 family protein [Candidatus Paceibacterota bacterium]